MTKHLIINGDDLGHVGGTVEAMRSVYEAGVLTSTTAMVNQPHWPEGAAFLRDHPDLGAGVHLVMNAGRPILPPEEVPSLVDADGCFRNGSQLIHRYGRLRLKELKAELRAQIEKFIADSGRQPDHLDLHCHYPYIFPSWFRTSVELAQEYGHIPVRMPFDNRLAYTAQLMSEDKGFPAWYIRWQGRRYQRMVARHGLKRPDYFEPTFSLMVKDERQRSTEYLLSLLDGLLDGTTELLAHPGTEDWRARDTAALLDPRVGQRIAELGIELIDFGDLA